jgi:hypothetical protein
LPPGAIRTTFIAPLGTARCARGNTPVTSGWRFPDGKKEELLENACLREDDAVKVK